jgi:2-keto-4-pentenoate hydratase
MPLTQADVDDLASRLRTAELDRRPVQPVTEVLPGLAAADAYRIQRGFVDLRRRDEGSRLTGRKIGATNPVIQSLLGVDMPDYGHLLDTMVLEDGARIRHGLLIQPRVEAEVAFHLAQGLRGPGVTVRDVLLATRAISATFEIIDSRIQDWRISFADTVADNGSSALVVVGSTILPVIGLDLRTIGVVMERNGEVVETGAGAASLGHPARAVAWLANALGEFGEGLEPGQLVLSGALTSAPLARPGDLFQAHFAGLGTITCSFDGPAEPGDG